LPSNGGRREGRISSDTGWLTLAIVPIFGLRTVNLKPPWGSLLLAKVDIVCSRG